MFVDILKYVLLFLFLYFIYDLLTRGYLNPYKLYMVMGKKGSGKTTLLTKFACKFLKKGWHVYTTETINVEGVRKFDVSMVGQYTFEWNSVVLIDEVGMIWDNRNFKAFAESVRNWFKLQRHYKCYVFLFSQTFDVDKKLRDLTDGIYLVENKFRVISWAKLIRKDVKLLEADDDHESRVAENLKFVPFLMWPAGARIFTWIPKYSKYFDSHVAPWLPPMPYEIMIGPQPMVAAERSQHTKTIILLRWEFIKKLLRTPSFGLASLPQDSAAVQI